MRLLLAYVLSLCVLSPAHGSGGLWCDVDDHPIIIHVQSGMTHGMGAPLFNFRAQVAIDDSAVTEDLRSTGFEHPTQYWLDSESLNLLLYWEREGDKPHGYVELTIMTRYVDEDGSYRGEYQVAVADEDTRDAAGEPRRYKGELTCGVE